MPILGLEKFNLLVDSMSRYNDIDTLPVYSDNGEKEEHNLFYVAILIRQVEDKRKYLYDLVNVKTKRVPA